MLKSTCSLLWVSLAFRFSQSAFVGEIAFKTAGMAELQQPVRFLQDIPHIDAHAQSDGFLALREQYGAGRRDFYLDLDETLWNRDFNEIPQVQQVLKTLVSDDQNSVFIITLGELEKLKVRLLNHMDDSLVKKLYLGCEGGLEVGRLNEPAIIKPKSAPLDQNAIERKVVGLFQGNNYNIDNIKFQKGHYDFVIVTKNSGLGAQELEKVETQINLMLAQERDYQHLELRRSSDGTAWIICPKEQSKGRAVEQLITKRRPSFAMSMGDSDADEEMHRVLRSYGHFSVIVNSDANIKSVANFRVRNPEETRAFLSALAARGSTSTRGR